MMRIAGHILLWIGFLGAAFASVCRLEQTEPWTTIPWGGYGSAMAVGIVGVLLLRIASRHDEGDDDQTESEYSVLRQSLHRVAEVVGRLRAMSEVKPAEVLRSIDDECADPLADFADSRQSLVKRFGLSIYADVMTEFASAERYINRCWSAAADGYVDEVADCLKRAEQHLHNAVTLMDRAEG